MKSFCSRADHPQGFAEGSLPRKTLSHKLWKADPHVWESPPRQAECLKIEAERSVDEDLGHRVSFSRRTLRLSVMCRIDEKQVLAAL